MANVKKSVWYGELDRFGYVLKTVGATEKEVRDALSKEYIRAYKDINGADPRKEIAYRYNDESTYYELAMEDMVIDEMVFGKVEWD